MIESEKGVKIGCHQTLLLTPFSPSVTLIYAKVGQEIYDFRVRPPIPRGLRIRRWWQAFFGAVRRCQTYRRPDWLVLLLLVCAFDIGACCCLYAFAVAYMPSLLPSLLPVSLLLYLRSMSRRIERT
jgi:hypothetical protein